MSAFCLQQILELYSRLGSGKRRDALVFARPGEAIHLLPLFEAHRHTVRFSQPDDRLHAVSMASSRDHDSVQRAPCCKRLFDRMESRHPVHVLVSLQEPQTA